MINHNTIQSQTFVTEMNSKMIEATEGIEWSDLQSFFNKLFLNCSYCLEHMLEPNKILKL